MPELWGRPTWQIESDPDPECGVWNVVFWLAVGAATGVIVGYVAWRLFR